MNQGREMTLEEYIGQLPIKHRARQEFLAMISQTDGLRRSLFLQSIADASQRDRLLEEVAALQAEIDVDTSLISDYATEQNRMREAFEKFINQVHENALEPDKLYIYEGRARAALKEAGDE